MCVDDRLILRQLTDLNFKMVPSLFALRDISARILKFVLYPPAEAHSRRSQASQKELFARIVNVFKLT